jgi:ATP/maltotriose-dependent transcriptional regulator MalT
VEIDAEDHVPESLYRFFAEEVLAALGDDVRTGLATIAIAPVLDHELVLELLGARAARKVCRAALDAGILVERGSQLELHPLARSFLEDRSGSVGADLYPNVVEWCISHYRGARDWDAAYDVIARLGLDLLASLLSEALDDLLDTARLSTIETWCALASEASLESPVFGVARAEVALRRGRHAEAQVFAEAAVAPDSELTFRALSVAGRAAHLASREQEALELYRQAEACAPTDGERRDALWGQLMCAAELELPEASSTLEELNAAVRPGDARDVVRSAAYTLSYQMHLGSLELSSADMASELLGAVGDPIIASAFQAVYATALGLSARYQEAIEASTTLLATVRRYRFDFAVPYALCAAAIGHAGLRQWRAAERRLQEALKVAQARHDRHAEQFCFSVLVRALVQQGRHKAALLLEVPPLQSSLPAARAEVLCSRALALTAAGRIEEAKKLIEQSRGTTRAIEPLVLISAVEAISALKLRDGNAIERVHDLVETAFATGAVDLLVTAYRSSSELLAVLLRGPGELERVFRLVRKARDDDLARTLGHTVSPDDDPRNRLTRRECDVYELLCQGLTNAQIAALLFISDVTVKVHAHHIYDKLGIRSRTALALQAALTRADHATSATIDAGTEELS